eukprot:7105698-Prymnesium_polylepis.2
MLTLHGSAKAAHDLRPARRIEEVCLVWSRARSARARDPRKCASLTLCPLSALWRKSVQICTATGSSLLVCDLCGACEAASA